MTSLFKPLWLMLALKENWDGDGAPPPSYVACSLAACALRQLPECLIVTGVDADAIGGVVLYFDTRDRLPERQREAWLEIRNSGRILICAARGDGSMTASTATNVEMAWCRAVDFLTTGRMIP